MKSIIIILSIALTYHSVNAQKHIDTIKVYFELGISTPNKSSMAHLDSLGYYDKLPINEQYGIIGYADYLGAETSNITLSQERANYVQKQLLGLGIKPENITTVSGKGEISRDVEQRNGYPNDRRVDIIIGGFKQKQPVAEKKRIFVNKTPMPVKHVDMIVKAEKNESIALENLLFLPGRHILREQSEETLFDLYIAMKNHPSLKINIEGHICCLKNTTGDGYDYDTNDFHLSVNRAKAVYDYLIEHGIDEDRMHYEGFGISKPLKWPERSLADENMNRRVEIRILDK